MLLAPGALQGTLTQRIAHGTAVECKLLGHLSGNNAPPVLFCP